MGRDEVSATAQNPAMTLVFLDTEFTGLAQIRPRLISVGAVTEDGRHEFYAELPRRHYEGKADDWVRRHVLPLLEGGPRVMTPEVLRRQFLSWLRPLGRVRLVSDAPDYDVEVLRDFLTPWPTAIAPDVVRFGAEALGPAHRERLELYRDSFFTQDRPQHHALYDAQALRHAWQRAKRLEVFADLAVEVGLFG